MFFFVIKDQSFKVSNKDGICSLHIRLFSLHAPISLLGRVCSLHPSCHHFIHPSHMLIYIWLHCSILPFNWH